MGYGDSVILGVSVLDRRNQVNSSRLAILLCTLVAGCAFNSDASMTMGFRGSPAWIEKAPRKDVEAYFDRQPLSELCWSYYYESGTRSRLRREAVLAEIEQSLTRRGLSKVVCDDYPPLNRDR